MRVRTYDEIDPLAAFRLGVLTFGIAWDEAKVRRVRSHDRTYLEEFALYAEEHGRVLAQVVPRRLAVGTRLRAPPHRGDARSVSGTRHARVGPDDEPQHPRVWRVCEARLRGPRAVRTGNPAGDPAQEPEGVPTSIREALGPGDDPSPLSSPDAADARLDRAAGADDG